MTLTILSHRDVGDLAVPTNRFQIVPSHKGIRIEVAVQRLSKLGQRVPEMDGAPRPYPGNINRMRRLAYPAAATYMPLMNPEG